MQAGKKAVRGNYLEKTDAEGNIKTTEKNKTKYKLQNNDKIRKIWTQLHSET